MRASLLFTLLVGLAGPPLHAGRVSQEARETKPQPPPAPADELAHGWAQWRGPLATGVAPYADPPVRWSESENVRWKSAIPGKGHSSPVLWGERVFLTTAVPFGDALGPFIDDAPGTHDSVPVTQQQRFLVLALDRSDGKVL